MQYLRIKKKRNKKKYLEYDLYQLITITLSLANIKGRPLSFLIYSSIILWFLPGNKILVILLIYAFLLF